MPEEEEALYTAQEVADMKGVKVNTVYAAIGRGRLSTVEKYGRTLIKQSDADAFNPKPRPARRRGGDQAGPQDGGEVAQ